MSLNVCGSVFCSCSSMIPCRGSRKLTLKRDVRDQAELNFSSRKYR